MSSVYLESEIGPGSKTYRSFITVYHVFTSRQKVRRKWQWHHSLHACTCSSYERFIHLARSFVLIHIERFREYSSDGREEKARIAGSTHWLDDGTSFRKRSNLGKSYVHRNSYMRAGMSGQITDKSTQSDLFQIHPETFLKSPSRPESTFHPDGVCPRCIWCVDRSMNGHSDLSPAITPPIRAMPWLSNSFVLFTPSSEPMRFFFSNSDPAAVRVSL